MLHYLVHLWLLFINQNFKFKVVDDRGAHDADKFGDCKNNEVFRPVFVNFDLIIVRILAYEIKILSIQEITVGHIMDW